MRGSHRARRRREKDGLNSAGASGPTPEEIRRVVEPVIAEQGFELLELTYGGGRTSAVLRLVLDHPEAAVTLEDCSGVSRAVGRLLDGLDLIPKRYHLEVSSPGLDRPLRQERDYLRFRGSMIKAVLSEPGADGPEADPGGPEGGAGRRSVLGRIAGYDPDQGTVLLETDRETLRIPRSRIIRARLVPEFPFPSKPPKGPKALRSRPRRARR